MFVTVTTFPGSIDWPFFFKSLSNFSLLMSPESESSTPSAPKGNAIRAAACSAITERRMSYLASLEICAESGKDKQTQTRPAKKPRYLMPRKLPQGTRLLVLTSDTTH